MRLPQLERVGDDLQAVVQHAARIGVVMGLRRGELLDQLGVAFQRGEVQRGELPARQRGALPNVFQQLLPARRRQQRCGRLRPHQPFAGLGGRFGRWRTGGGRHPFALEQREHGEPRTAGRSGEPLAFRVGPFPWPHSLAPSPALWPLRKPLDIGQRRLPDHNQCGFGPSRIDTGRLAVPPYDGAVSSTGRSTMHTQIDKVRKLPYHPNIAIRSAAMPEIHEVATLTSGVRSRCPSPSGRCWAWTPAARWRSTCAAAKSS